MNSVKMVIEALIAHYLFKNLLCLGLFMNFGYFLSEMKNTSDFVSIHG